MGKEVLGAGSTRMSRDVAVCRAISLLGHTPAPDFVDRAIHDGAAVQIEVDLQPPGSAHMEAECALLMARLAVQAPSCGATEERLLEVLLKNYEATQPFPLTEPQRDAVRMAHRHRICILGGYAGSGKTTVLRGVCDTLEQTGRKPLIVTFSGRAAQRAAEATGRRAITVARFLIEQEKSGRGLGRDSALVADEASMLGLTEIWQILRRLGQASLLLCGDPAQLPPVSPGIVFHVLAAAADMPKVILDRVHRQSQTSGIPQVAENLRNGIAPVLAAFSGAMPGVSFTPCTRGDLNEQVLRIESVLRDARPSGKEIQIVAPTNDEIDAINAHMHRLHLQTDPGRWPETGHLAENEPVMWTRNDYERGLMNGSMGRIRKIENNRITATLDATLYELKPSDAAFLTLAYAISVHKAQGSQWKRVIIPVFQSPNPNFQSRFLDRSLIYTALTRAAEQVIFLGDWEALQKAIERPPAAERREVGFPTWFKLAKEFERRRTGKG